MSTLNANTIRVTTLQHTNGTNALTIDSTGRVLTPTRPSFYAHSGGGNYTLTNQADIPLEATRFNIGGNYNGGNYRFTAPVAGVYQFNFTTYVTGSTGRMAFKLNGGNISGNQNEFSHTSSYSMAIYLNVNDYITVGDWQNISGGSMWLGHSHFSGYLVG